MAEQSCIQLCVGTGELRTQSGAEVDPGLPAPPTTKGISSAKGYYGDKREAENKIQERIKLEGSPEPSPPSHCPMQPAEASLISVAAFIAMLWDCYTTSTAYQDNPGQTSSKPPPQMMSA